MKKLLFFALFICFASFVNGQTKSLGLNTSYLSHLISYNSRVGNKTNWKEFYKSPQFNLVYNHFIDEKHGIVAELGIIRRKREFSEQSVIPFLTINKNYHANYSLHYIFKYEQFFIKSGFNVQIFDVVRIREDIIDGTTTARRILTDIEQIEPIPEFHFALGRDFDLGKINLRLNGFVERAFMVDNYIDVGVAAGVFYELGK